MNVLGLDLSLNHTGWYGTASNTYGLIEPPEKCVGVQRLVFLQDALGQVLFQQKHPDLIIMEGYSFGSRNKAHQVGEWGGIARMTIYRGLMRGAVVTPNSLKQFVSGKGNSEKEMMLKETFKRWGQDFNDNNVCDAFGLAMMGLALKSPNEYESMYGSLTAVQKTALTKIETLPQLSPMIRRRTRQ